MSNTFVNVPVGKQAQNMDISPQFQPYSGVEIIVNEDESIFVGNRSGRVLSITNPWGARQQAENILDSLTSTGFQYQPYTATGALLNPAAEIGDGVTLNGFYSGIYKMTRNYNSLMAADIEAPQDEEVDHEYPFEPKQDRIYRREIADAQASISLNQDAIEAEVTRATTAEGSLSSRITQNATSINAKVSQTGGNNSSFGREQRGFQGHIFRGRDSREDNRHKRCNRRVHHWVFCHLQRHDHTKLHILRRVCRNEWHCRWRRCVQSDILRGC